MIQRLIMIIFLITYMVSSLANDDTRSFIITIFDRRIKVVSPEKFYSKVSVIIENKTLDPIYGKLEYGDDKFLYLTIPSESNRSRDVKLQKGDTLKFVPLAPAFQEAILIFNKGSYEIPSKEQTQ